MKYIDIRTTGADTNIIDALCVNKATFEQLSAVLALAETGSEILIQVKEMPKPQAVQTPIK